MRWECQKRFSRHWPQMKLLVSNSGMHHGTCVAPVPLCMSPGGETLPVYFTSTRVTMQFPGWKLRHKFWRKPICGISMKRRQFLMVRNLYASRKNLERMFSQNLNTSRLCLPIISFPLLLKPGKNNKTWWRGALMFSLICARINGWVNNGEAGNSRRHRAHYDVMVMR